MSDNAPKYVLDGNVFIEASRRYYSFDFAKPFWVALETFAKKGLICSIDRVNDEILKGDDALKSWAQRELSNYFLSTKQPLVLEAYAKVVQWAQKQPQYTSRAKDVFMEEKEADAWIVAFALAHKATIVTHEAYSPEAQKTIPIPNACREFSINYCDTFEMLKQLKFKF